MSCRLKPNSTLFLQMFPSPVIVTWTTRQEEINIHFGAERSETLCGVLELSESKQSNEVTAFPFPKVNNAVQRGSWVQRLSSALGW